MPDDDLAERVAALEEDVEAIITDRETYRSEVLGPRLDELAAARDDAHDHRAELAATLEAVRERVRELEAELASLTGLADDETSTPKKRALDLRQGLIQEARATADATVAAMHWEDVKRFFARNGHGDISKPDCYKAMRWAAGEDETIQDSPAFWTEEEKLRKNGRDVRAICVDTDALPNSTAHKDGSNPTTGKNETEGVSATNPR